MRLLVAKGADPNIQDTNGNTVLHMLVVHDKKVGKSEAVQGQLQCDFLLRRGSQGSSGTPIQGAKQFFSVPQCTDPRSHGGRGSIEAGHP